MSGDGDDIHLPWHILPHRSAAVTPESNSVNLGGTGAGTLNVSNSTGALDGRVEVFSLTGTSGNIPNKFQPSPGDNFSIIDLRSVGVRQSGSNIQFAVNTFGDRSHPLYPAEFDINIDSNRDGNVDFIVFNRELGGAFASGQCAVAIFRVTPPAVLGDFFFCDADLNSANIILTAPMSTLGLSPATTFDFAVGAFDNYFTGALTDSIVGMTYTPNAPRFTGTGVPGTGVPAGGSSTLNITHNPANDALSPSQTGLLLWYRDAKGNEASPITVNP